ncbi:carboxypeptidase [Sodiomyces alkalinus F11]|uniref:Carboxypeptidase M14B n=1 Tax=Sodiomyces alkalinus (strain CBS 110278 / VKM F-3762 / F11) TaxID=1314773 RepID=A0A3N2PVA5_SODAK|nr:carboxypeptidase [Sodiomyces alkalinus F11]ROT38443.1 carboxypeptidase [Sodiomyces alkalinus F11]
MRVATQAGLFGLVSLASAVQYGYNHVPVRQDPDHVAAHFQDVDIDLYSPAFLNPEGRLPGFPNGTQGPTSHEVMESYMEELASRNDYMTYHTANFTSEELRSYPFVHLSTNGHLNPCRRGNSTEKIRVWVQGAQHGNEPAADESLLALLGQFDSDPEWAAEILDKLDIVVLPRANPDGVYYFQRTLATNLDPNRDHIKLNRQQSRDIKTLFNEYKPHIVMDMHEYGATTQYGRYYHASDGLFAAAKNLNIHSDIRALSEDLFAKNIGDAMDEQGLRWEPYATGSSSTNLDFVPHFNEAGTDAKIGRNALGLTQSVTFLIEARGINLADQEFQRRTAASLVMATSILETAANNAEQVFRAIEDGIDAFIRSDDDIVLTDYTRVESRLFTMVDHTNGSLAQVPITFASATPAQADLTRSRPEAYLIPVAWADVADRLRAAGLKVETLEEPWSGTVEALTITSTTVAGSYYEGALRVTATAEARKRELTLSAGSFLVSARQKNAALAFVALEPETIDSFVTFNIIPVNVRDEYPIFRVMS